MVSAVAIVGLLFGLSRAQAQASQAHYEAQQIQTEKAKQVETLSKDLQQLKKAKAVSDTQLKKKAAKEAEMKAQIDKLNAANADLQAQADTAAQEPARTGGMGGANTEGNAYDYGYCTWYVKNRRPDIPNDWGNAAEWLGAAQASGWPTGSNPSVGAIAQQGGGLGHVAYVEAVNNDGTIYISEMNYEGWGVQSYRTADASSFNYIY